MTTPTPAGRDGGGARANPDGRITRDVVLAAALELIDRDGVDGLSMRRLAGVLGRDPMILCLDILLTGLTNSLTPPVAAQAGLSPLADDLHRGRYYLPR